MFQALATLSKRLIAGPVKHPVIAGVAVMALLLAGIYFCLVFVPRSGEVADFWEQACGIELAGYRGTHRGFSSGGIRPSMGAVYVYYVPTEHDTYEYSVSAEAVRQRADAVTALLHTPIIASHDRACSINGTFCSDYWLKWKNARRLKCMARLDEEKGDFVAFLHSITWKGWSTGD
jgi:hypothetical protein